MVFDIVFLLNAVANFLLGIILSALLAQLYQLTEKSEQNQR